MLSTRRSNKSKYIDFFFNQVLKFIKINLKKIKDHDQEKKNMLVFVFIALDIFMGFNQYKSQ
tara:strand:- start:357 stop:542 length:186 start_codon:yes stop_codon:yes gene_type:complete